MQQLLNDLLAQLFDEEIGIRQASLQLLNHILKRYLVHPIQCVGHLVALQGDHHVAIASRAYRALMTVVEKDSKLVLSRLGDGVLASFKFQAQVFGVVRPLVESNAKGVTTHESILTKLYMALRTTKTSRQGFLHALMHLYETELENINFLKFLIRIIATLSFACQEEVLYVIYHMNRLTSYSGAALLSNLKEHYATSKNIPTDCSVKFIPGILFLLRAKQFLKSFYNLSSAKCASYDPAELKQNPLNNRIPIENVDTAMSLNFDDLDDATPWWGNSQKCHDFYVIFKKEMKNDEDDINVNTITTKSRKRTIKRKTESSTSPEKKKPRQTKKQPQPKKTAGGGKKGGGGKKKQPTNQEEGSDDDEWTG